MTQFNEWKIWNGGECPVPEGTYGRVQWRNESRISAEKRNFAVDLNEACRWTHQGVAGDVIAYQTLKMPTVAELI